MSSCPKSHGAPGSIGSPHRAQTANPAATTGTNAWRNLRCRPALYFRSFTFRLSRRRDRRYRPSSVFTFVIGGKRNPERVSRKRQF